MRASLWTTRASIFQTSRPIESDSKGKAKPPCGNITDEFNARLLAAGCGWCIVRVATCRMTTPRGNVWSSNRHRNIERKRERERERETVGEKIEKKDARRVTLVVRYWIWNKLWGVLHGPAALHGTLDGGYEAIHHGQVSIHWHCLLVSPSTDDRRNIVVNRIYDTAGSCVIYGTYGALGTVRDFGVHIALTRKCNSTLR